MTPCPPTTMSPTLAAQMDTEGWIGKVNSNLNAINDNGKLGILTLNRLYCHSN